MHDTVVLSVIIVTSLAVKEDFDKLIASAVLLHPIGVDRKGFMQQAALLGSLVSLLPTAAQAKGVKRVKNAPLVTLDSGVTYQVTRSHSA